MVVCNAGQAIKRVPRRSGTASVDAEEMERVQPSYVRFTR